MKELPLFLPLLLFALALVYPSKCNVIYVGDAKNFTALLNKMSSGTDFEGTTIRLSNDIDLSGEVVFNLDNNSYAKPFSGVFDGLGHVIRNLYINTTRVNYAGLVSYSQGMTIKNVVLDSSCTFIFRGPHKEGSIIFGSFIGFCNAEKSDCGVESVVNMAEIYLANSNTRTYVGGVIGLCNASSFNCVIRNSLNFGLVNQSSASGSISIGGIIGSCAGYENSNTKCTIEKNVNYGTVMSLLAYPTNLGGIVGSCTKGTVRSCLNYGSLIDLGDTTVSRPPIYIGGIVGSSTNTTVENCVNVGSMQAIKGVTTHVSYISNGEILHCYVDDSIVGSYSIETTNNTEIANFSGPSFGLRESVSVGEYSGASLLSALNAFPEQSGRWILNKNSRSVNFYVNGKNTKFLTLESQIIILPELSSGDDVSFSEWYTDDKFTNQFSLTEILGDISLYCKNGSISHETISSSLAESSSLTESSPSEKSSSSSSSSSSSTLIEPSSSSIISSYLSLKSPSSSSFSSYSSSTLSSITISSSSSSTVSSSSLPSTHYSSSLIQSAYVEVVLSTKGLSEDEIKDIIEKYTDDQNFEVIKFIDTDDGIKVILEFSDAVHANDFVRKVNEEIATKRNDIFKAASITRRVYSNCGASYSTFLSLFLTLVMYFMYF